MESVELLRRVVLGATLPLQPIAWIIFMHQF